MNSKKWINKKIGTDTLVMKLGEEYGEVCNAYMEKGDADLDEELSHVIFIAEVLRWRLALNQGLDFAPPEVVKDFKVKARKRDNKPFDEEEDDSQRLSGFRGYMS